RPLLAEERGRGVEDAITRVGRGSPCHRAGSYRTDRSRGGATRGATRGEPPFAVQLADRAGAHVVASVGTAERGEGLVALAEVYALLAPGGSVQSVGMASLAPTTIDFEQARRAGGGARIEAFVVGPGFGLDLAFLLSLVGSGGLDPQVDWRGP